MTELRVDPSLLALAALAYALLGVLLFMATRRIAQLRQQVDALRARLRTLVDDERAAQCAPAAPPPAACEVLGTDRLRQRRATRKPRPEPPIDVSTMPYWEPRRETDIVTESEREHERSRKAVLD